MGGGSEYQQSFGEKPLEETPTQLYGLRTWNHSRVSGELSLVGMKGYHWASGTNHSTCQRARVADNHRFDPDCTCGFYAYFENPFTSDWITGYSTVYSSTFVGIVRGWGQVAIGARGFRCEYSEIMAVTPILSYDGRRSVILSNKEEIRRLGASVNVVSDYDSMLREFPATDPSDIIDPSELDRSDLMGSIPEWQKLLTAPPYADFRMDVERMRDFTPTWVKYVPPPQPWWKFWSKG